MQISSRSRRLGALSTLLGLTALLVPTTAIARGAAPDDDVTAAKTPYELVEDRDLADRLPQPEDRYALASGCYAIEAPGVGYLAPDGGVAATMDDAEGFHFRATRLGEYLLATDEGPNTDFEGAWWDDRHFLAVDMLGGQIGPVSASISPQLVVEEAPSPDAEWRIVAAGDDGEARVDLSKEKKDEKDADKRFKQVDWQTYHVINDANGRAISADASGFGVAASSAATGLAFHLLDDAERCAVWPEIDVNVDGRPTGNDGGSTGPVKGFFESHVHGMAFEFLGGEARCGRPWHEYGVEYALVDCEDHGPNGHAAALEFVVSGTNPATGHDPIGWPTFGYWPNPSSLTHEQYYYRWLERAYLGGLRLVTNLFVDNTALCQLWPVKKNSCNEMDGVRLQAQRIYELQDYIDAQSGGPGEGWFRIVTSPAQAREVINSGRLAMVLGIEVSVLFDCGEMYDVPLCSEDEIEDRLTEVYDMGIRQMELVNKFDNALTGVTGDGGSTGVVVNIGNRHVTGHFWDMQTCPPTEDGHDHEHDKRQMNFVDDNGPMPGEIDVLAGQALEAFGATKGYAAPAYPAGPHCNSRGLTDLGRAVIRGMAERGMIFDPDHMSAAGARESLDFIEDVLIPEDEAAAAAEGRAPRKPAVISSHSWANDEIYKRIYELDGMIGPRTASADRFVDYWADRKAWAEVLAPDQLFGIGYGADTNGFGGQPGRRGDAPNPVTYDTGWEAPIGGVTVHQQVSGLKAYDINEHGVAHYGLFADWYRDVQLAADVEYAHLGGGEAVLEDMLNGSEAYLRMWERSVYGMNDCVVDGSTIHTEDLHAALGGNLEGFLRAVGQPISRDDHVYTYCVEEGGRAVALDVAFVDGVATSVAPSSTDVQALAGGSAATASSRDVGSHGDVHAAEGSAAGAGSIGADHAEHADHDHVHEGADAAVLASAQTSEAPNGGLAWATLALLGLGLTGAAAGRLRSRTD